MWTRRLLKENAKIAFKRNFWACVAVSLIAIFLGGSTSSSVVNINFNVEQTVSLDEYDYYHYDESYNAILNDVGNMLYTIITSPIFIIIALFSIILGISFSILVANVVNIGHKRYYLENREHKTNIGKVFYGFNGGRYGSYVWVMFWKGLYVWAWSLLLVIPGIIKSYSYRMIPYILAENPYISKERAFDISKQMMNGHKWEAFVLELSFFGWHLLSALTAGIVGTFYVAPYVDATNAEFYSAVKAEAIQKGITDSIELPGVSSVNFDDQFTQHI